jgi:hypothetical protein
MKTLPISLARTLLLACAAFGAAGAVSSDALACGGEWAPYIEIDHRPQGVARAQKLLDRGNHVAAASTVLRMMPHVRSLQPKSAAVVARAQRILAVAIARGDGALAVGKDVPASVKAGWTGKDADERRANLQWAVATLRGVEATRKNDPAVQTDLAEAMARLDSTRDEAKRLLEQLAEKDLIASAQGYATLAALRAAAGDEPGRKLAAARCAAMATGTLAC